MHNVVLPAHKREQRAFATRKVTAQVNRAEKSMDQAGIELLKLGVTLLEARIETGLSATFAPQTLGGTVAAISAWSASRDQTIATHLDLLKVAGILGTREIAFGDGDERPSDGMSPQIADGASEVA